MTRLKLDAVVSFRVPVELRDAFRETAKRLYLTPGNAGRVALSEWVRRNVVESLADRYDREATTLSKEELDAIYDDDYFEAMKEERGG